MGFRLDSGALLQRSPDGRWFIVYSDGEQVMVTEKPWLALLLLEEDPEKTIDNLPGFPFQSVVEVGLKSRLTRYVVGAMKWQRSI